MRDALGALGLRVKEGSAGEKERTQGWGVQGRPLLTFAKEVPIEQGLLGTVGGHTHPDHAG